MAAVPNSIRQNKLVMFGHYFPLTNNIFPRSSHNLSAGHSEPGQDVVLDGSFGPHQLLDEMLKRDVESATSLIGHFAKQNQHRQAILCFLRMLFLDITPNEYTFGTVIHSSVVLEDLHLGRQIHSYAKKISLSSNVFVGSSVLDLYVKLSNINDALRAFQDIHEPNVVSYTTLIRGYIKQGRFDEAGGVFRSMPERNVVSWNTMISGCSQSGKNEEAVNYFVEMLRDSVVPSQSTYPCAVIAAANVGALGIGRSMHASAIKFLGELSLFLANSLISFYAKCGSMEDSLLTFNKMRERNIVSWNAVICGHAQNGLGKDAIEMYEKMKVKGIQPNSITLLGLLLACNHVGLIDEGYKYFNQARYEDPSLLKSEHYACMIDLLSRSGRFQEAERFLHDLPFDPGVGFWKALLGGCQVHSNLELGEVAARKILELDPGDVSSYVMLSNAHSAAGRWQNVLDIRQKMREKGLSRTPGSSWIEIKSKVHVFVTGDKRHSSRDDIYMALGFFLQHVMDSQDTNTVIEF
ncbi:pentatricopeptide repeat-containing protein At5g42450, mitochondrial isoform X1 [Sesamum indicum]|uniref:Pentatricopeptide repeat-containing protein At5g42450, mitochondrial isoform X1 n=1 Tax=Sesamum indicum TaxID=4182 RepID=A0A6I9UK81_SESIN|nr:pentatricopeptide repeat-containing protein At5g42450, mitochondrial isoform X1 [Sesamum indicum]